MLAAVALVSALALTATACESGDTDASGDSSATAAADDGKLKIPDDIADRLKEHGIDLDKWRDGAWKNWDKDKWLREAQDFVNPIIEGLWDPDRMRDADEPDQPEVDENDISGDQGVTDPTPKPVQAKAVPTTYHENAPTAGEGLLRLPEGTMVCSATVVQDPANPGKSNMVWTAGHCVHAGKKGGWYRNIAFVPSYNDSGMLKRRRSAGPPRRRSLRTASGGATGRRPRTSGSSRAARRAVTAPRTTSPSSM